jgi:hypothetical protein
VSRSTRNQPLVFLNTERARATARAPGAAWRQPVDETDTAESRMEAGAVFISYAGEDREAARRLCNFLEEEAGIYAGVDNRWLEAGDDWDHKIRRNIKNCSYFMPLISSASTRQQEGYFRREWALAAERAMDFADSAVFIDPVAIDETPEDADRSPSGFAGCSGRDCATVSVPMRSAAA